MTSQSTEWRRRNVVRARAVAKAWRKANKAKLSAYYAEYYAQGKRKKPTKEQLTAWRLQQKYNLTIEQRSAISTAQNHCCAICNIHEEKLSRPLAVDHCHKTGRVRGLLCTPCNTALGNFRDDPTLLRNAAEYLEQK